MRVCTKCGEEKPLTSKNFVKDKKYKLGYTRWCRDCYNEYHRIKQKEYYNANPKKYNQIGRRSYNKHHKVRREQQNLYFREVYYPKNTAKYAIKAAERRRNVGGDLTEIEWREIQEEYMHMCAYCNDKKDLTKDRIDSSLSYTRDNVVPACGYCNGSKGNKPLLLWLGVGNGN